MTSASAASTAPSPGTVRVGVGCVLLDGKNRVLLGLRKGKHGGGTWAFPGGHLEVSESWEACAAREVFEETGLRLESGKFQLDRVTNDVYQDVEQPKHYVTLFMKYDGVVEVGPGEVVNKEPEKCERWEWVDLNSLLNDAHLKVKEGRTDFYYPRFLSLENYLLTLDGARPGGTAGSCASKN